jgi:hypothetical protein
MVSLWLRVSAFLIVFVPSAHVMGQGKTPLSLLKPGDMVCCVDASGQRACGNTLQRQCVGRAYTIYNSSGLRVREVAAPVTAEERARQAEENRRKEAEEIALRDKRRRNAALFSTYSSLEDIDRMLAKAEADIKKEIAEAEAKIAAAHERLNTLKETAARYDSASLPPDVANSQRNEEMVIKFQTELIKLKQRDLEQARKKFADDKRRYLDLTTRSR